MENQQTNQLPIYCGGLTAGVLDISYSKVCESDYYLAMGYQKGKASIYRGATGDHILTCEGHKDDILGVSLNDKATLMITGSNDKTARLWNAYDGSLIKKFRQSNPVSSVSFDMKSKSFATGNLNANPSVSVYDIEHLSKHPVVEFKGHSRGVRNISFCKTDSCIISSSYDRSVRMWDLRSGKETNSIFLPHHAKSLEMCADNETLTIGYGSSIIFLNAERFEVLAQRKLLVKLEGATLHPEKSSFVCCSSWYIYKYDYAEGELLTGFKAHDDYIRCVKYSPDGKKFACCTSQGYVMLWPHTVQPPEEEESNVSLEVAYEEGEIRDLNMEDFSDGPISGEESVDNSAFASGESNVDYEEDYEEEERDSSEQFDIAEEEELSEYEEEVEHEVEIQDVEDHDAEESVDNSAFATGESYVDYEEEERDSSEQIDIEEDDDEEEELSQYEEEVEHEEGELLESTETEYYDPNINEEEYYVPNYNNITIDDSEYDYTMYDQEHDY
ncbi:serine-threonine kinase receptor-associated protein [Drosophila tropicalis]|uniref:serine-threonine kinase receptor-associated protein n=1 Tax=Drosophila tropicalis TaxID=46794 RepID=UPI0035AC0A3C